MAEAVISRGTIGTTTAVINYSGGDTNTSWNFTISNGARYSRTGVSGSITVPGLTGGTEYGCSMTTEGGGVGYLTFYTKPEAFSFGASKGAEISKVLTATKVNSFGEYLNQYYHWNQQKDENPAKTHYCNAGDQITATIYNNIVDDIKKVSGKAVSKVKKGDLITAKVWNDLADAVK